MKYNKFKIMKKGFLIVILILISLSKSFTYAVVTETPTVNAEKIEVFDADSATTEYINTLTPEQKARSDSYFEGGYWIQLWGLVLEIIVAWIFLSLGLSGWIRKIAARNKNVNVQNIIYIVFYFLFAYAITFPFGVYTDFFREHQYSLSTMTFGSWFSEEMIGLALSLLFGSILLTILYIVIRKVKQNWWIWGSGVVILFVVFTMFIGPVFISPLFNDYEPLQDGKIKEEILSMARANGVPADNVYQFNASKQSTRISANVSGIGSTIRISLNDNLLNKCTPEEIQSVMAHELGHYVLNHVYKMIIFFSILIIIGFAFINWAFQKVIGKFGSRWEITGISDIGGLPLIMILFTIFFFFVSPCSNTIIRSQEVEADIFGLNTAREPDGSASIAIKLSEYRKINPSKVEEILFFDHPSGKTRINNAMRWKAEHLDE